jgi:hypothetical protein
VHVRYLDIVKAGLAGMSLGATQGRARRLV